MGGKQEGRDGAPSGSDQGGEQSAPWWLVFRAGGDQTNERGDNHRPVKVTPLGLPQADLLGFPPLSSQMTDVANH